MTPYCKPYYLLRREMFAQRVTQEDISRETGRCKSTVSDIFNGKREFTVRDCWAIMRMLQIDPAEMAAFFPEGGRASETET